MLDFATWSWCDDGGHYQWARLVSTVDSRLPATITGRRLASGRRNVSDRVMRLWSLHPAHLDRPGLVALWREGLLAQAVLAGRTRGYRHHPQLERFRECPSPRGALAAYLDAVRQEAAVRGYRFDPARVDDVPRWEGQLTVTTGQLELERAHLLDKLAVRSPADHVVQQRREMGAHPLFTVVPGPVAPWERAAGAPVRPADPAVRD